MGLGPEETGIERTVVLVPDVWVEDRLKAADELGVAPDQAVAELKRVHIVSLTELDEAGGD